MSDAAPRAGGDRRPAGERAGGGLRERLAGKRVVICVGSGGVGKTTVSAALALGLAMEGAKVAVVTIDPAKRLAGALGLSELASAPRRIEPELLAARGIVAEGELWAMMLDAKRTFDELVARLEPDPERLAGILENPVYRELSSAIAGSHELSAIAKLHELHEQHDFDTIVLDTPPSRNALDFLDAPGRMLAFMEGRALQVFLAPGGLTARLFGRGTALVFAIFARVTGVDLLGELSRFFASLGGVMDGFGAQTKAVARLLREDTSAFAIVTSPEPEPAREALFMAEHLDAAGMSRDAVIVNRVSSAGLHGRTPDQVASLLEGDLGPRLAGRVAANLADFDVLSRRDAATVSRLAKALGPPAPIQVPQLEEDVRDLAGLARVAGHLLG
ncbi:MAG TPA: ArsA-related P-loop ATPase [Solirubrobacteraceae bacterium]|nr:ArsA-related P-loop ATPase [Solirubrobacteraceae bacterium]